MHGSNKLGCESEALEKIIEALCKSSKPEWETAIKESVKEFAERK